MKTTRLLTAFLLPLLLSSKDNRQQRTTVSVENRLQNQNNRRIHQPHNTPVKFFWINIGLQTTSILEYA